MRARPVGGSPHVGPISRKKKSFSMSGACPISARRRLQHRADVALAFGEDVDERLRSRASAIASRTSGCRMADGTGD